MAVKETLCAKWRRKVMPGFSNAISDSRSQQVIVKNIPSCLYTRMRSSEQQIKENLHSLLVSVAEGFAYSEAVLSFSSGKVGACSLSEACLSFSGEMLLDRKACGTP
jgi:hypothetical protein